MSLSPLRIQQRHYYQPSYLAAPTAVLIAIIGSLVWLRRRERQNAAGSRGDGSADVGDYLKRMDDACIAHDPELFFRSARAALQASLANRWRCAPTAITRDSVEARLGSNNWVSRVFEMADEAAYSGIRQSIDFARWKALLQRYLSEGAFT